MRGMVLGSDANRLIVEATPAEVRQYSSGLAVEVLAARALVHDRMRDRNDWSATGRPTHGVAVLQTLCGCTDRYPIQWPPSREYHRAIASSLPTAADLDAVIARVRVFDLKNIVHVCDNMTGRNTVEAHYTERWSA